MTILEVDSIYWIDSDTNAHFPTYARLTNPVSISCNASLLSSDPLLTLYAAEFSFYAGIKAMQKIDN